MSEGIIGWVASAFVRALLHSMWEGAFFLAVAYVLLAIRKTFQVEFDMPSR